ncbi:MAG: trigger factor [Clostridia bacterium]|nr:trigger factor [Clostridia bacterium]
MTYKIGTKKDGKLTVEFKLNKEEWEAEVEKAYQKNKGKYKLSGFRQGKIPRKVLEKTYGEYLFYEDALNEACDRYFFEFLEKEKSVQAVDYPSISVKKLDAEGVEWIATITLLPEVELGAYTGLEVEKPKVSVTAKDVDAKLKDLQEKQARYVDVNDRAAKMGDLVNIDFAGSINGVAFEGGTAKDYELELGSHSFIEGFEEQVAGMKIDEQKDVNVTFPKEYHAKELAGKPAVFAVKLLAIREKQVPEIDDAFASDVSEFDTLEELKKSTKEEIKKEREEAAEKELENKLVEKVVENAKVEIPEVMINNQIARDIEDMKRTLQMQGMSYEMYLGYVGMTDEQFRETRKKGTENQIKMSLVLSELVKKENITVTDEDVENKLKELAEKTKKTVKDLKKDMNPSQKAVVENNIISDKVIKLLKEKNNIK